MFNQFALAAITTVFLATTPLPWTALPAGESSDDPPLDVIELAETVPTGEFYIVFPQDPTVTGFSST